METLFKKTSQKDQKIALRALKEVQSASDKIKGIKTEEVRIKIQETDDFITIPKNALKLLSNILQNMAEGKSISLIPSDAEISTQQAADLLNVSRPHLVKLLESGAIPFKKVGSHRRILMQDLIKYQNNLKNERKKQLDFLANQAQYLNLGYE